MVNWRRIRRYNAYSLARWSCAPENSAAKDGQNPIDPALATVMISDFKPYPDYKDSWVEWLGDVPTHWDVLPLKRIGEFSGGAGFPVSTQGTTDKGIMFVRVSDMNRPGNERRIVSAANTVSREVARSLGARIFESRSIIFPKVGGALLTNKRRIVGRPTCIDNNIMGCVVKGADPGFAFRVLAWLDFARMSKPGPVPAISEGEVREIRVAVPTRSEQAAIVRFLDHADRRIQRYIRAKQKMIVLLEEQKQAIIHHAVTGQIDVRTGQRYTAYKPSGVEWLGDIPKHWEVRRTRYIFREIDQRSVDGSEQHLSMSQSLGLVPSHLVENRTLVSENYTGGKVCRTDDLVLNRLKAHLGVFARAQQSGVISSDYTVLRPHREAKTEYFEQVLRSPSCRGELRTRAKGIVEGFWRLYTDELYDIFLPLPTMEEQELIIGWTKTISKQAERNVALCNRELVLLNEYRSRLIADVVTGKLDVREATPELPDPDFRHDVQSDEQYTIEEDVAE